MTTVRQTTERNPAEGVLRVGGGAVIQRQRTAELIGVVRSAKWELEWKKAIEDPRRDLVSSLQGVVFN